jgi:hypothetical protein
MKKLLILSVFALFAMSANVFGQSTGTKPAPGATHSYTITPGNASNTISWTVTKGNLTTSASTDAVISSNSAATTDIAWAASVVVGDWYYVHVVETGGGCSNEKVHPVQITASPFYLTLAAANATACYDGAVVVSLADPSTPNYDHGNTTITFTVTPSGLSSSYTGYSFNLNLAVPAGYNSTPVFSAGASISAGKVTVTNNNPVTITYTVDNTNVYTNASAANAADYTATATISGGKAINGVSDNNADGKYTDKTDVSRPNTSGITTN